MVVQNKKVHQVESVAGDSGFLYLTVDDQPYRIRWGDCSPKLVRAMQVERLLVKVAPSGYGLHWPLLDEDLAITPLLQQAERVTAPVAVGQLV